MVLVDYLIAGGAGTVIGLSYLLRTWLHKTIKETPEPEKIIEEVPVQEVKPVEVILEPKQEEKVIETDTPVLPNVEGPLFEFLKETPEGTFEPTYELIPPTMNPHEAVMFRSKQEGISYAARKVA